MSEQTSPRFGLVLDCADPDRLAAFWTAALDYINVGAAGAYVALYPRTGDGPKLLLQRVTEPKTAKNRMHLDIDATDIHAEARRLSALGATRVTDSASHEHGSTWILMADPEGNEFCICDGGNPPPRRTPPTIRARVRDGTGPSAAATTQRPQRTERLPRRQPAP